MCYPSYVLMTAAAMPSMQKTRCGAQHQLLVLSHSVASLLFGVRRCNRHYLNAPSACRLAQKLQQALGPDGVLFHVEPRLPHSWAILPTPSMASRQEVVTRFIAAEHAAAVAAAETPAAQHAAAHVAT
jgi:hypothetical protein